MHNCGHGHRHEEGFQEGFPMWSFFKKEKKKSFRRVEWWAVVSFMKTEMGFREWKRGEEGVCKGGGWDGGWGRGILWSFMKKEIIM